MRLVLAAVVVILGNADGGIAPMPFDGRALTRPTPARPIDWTYPEWARAKELGGLIKLKCVITIEGMVRDCEVLKSVPGLTEWAISKLTATRFNPATLDGRPVRVSYIFNILPRIEGRPLPPTGPVTWRPLLSAEMAAACKGPNAGVCLEVALSFLHPDGGQREPDRAGRLLGAACEGGLAEACQLLDQSFRPPRMIDDVPMPSFRVAADVQGDVICSISSDGRAHDCHGPPGQVAEWFTARIAEARFLPASFEKVPFETDHAIHFLLRRR